MEASSKPTSLFISTIYGAPTVCQYSEAQCGKGAGWNWAGEALSFKPN